VIQVHSLALGLGLVGIDQDDLSRKPAQQQGISEGCADIADANDRDARGAGMCAGLSCQSISLLDLSSP